MRTSGPNEFNYCRAFVIFFHCFAKYMRTSGLNEFWSKEPTHIFLLKLQLYYINVEKTVDTYIHAVY
jgi:hypothetical protein